MKNNLKPIITLSDLFRYGGEHLCPTQACSPYRYIEFLLEVCLLRKYKFESVLEIGPGTDPIFKYLKPQEYKSGTVIDYDPKITGFCKSHLANKKIESITLDMLKSENVKALDHKWEYVVANSILEHLKDDALFVENARSILKDNGIIICSTVLHQGLFNKWDYAVGHYRRYSPRELVKLFKGFREVQLIQSSLLQELVRPLFFKRIKHLLKNSLEENNLLVGEGYLDWGIPPYAKYFKLIRYLMPAYLLLDWSHHSLCGGIGFIIARK
jgi:SAM-dependent methyltransferase